jgi:vacuolar-type H+-ATPase subunit C/Vma6
MSYIVNNAIPRNETSYNKFLNQTEKVIGRQKQYKFSSNKDHSYNSHLGHNVYKHLEDKEQEIKNLKALQQGIVAQNQIEEEHRIAD